MPDRSQLRATSSKPSLDDNFALVRDLYNSGYAVEMLLAPEPHDEVSVSIPLPSMSQPKAEMIVNYPLWARLTVLAAKHGVQPKVERDFPRCWIGFYPVGDDGA